MWKSVALFQGLYMCSVYGEIKSLSRETRMPHGGWRIDKEKILSPDITRDGYALVTLFKDGKRFRQQVHRIVASTFIPNPHNLPQVNHKDGNKTNNRVDNLEWVTGSENIIHAFQMGLCITSDSLSAAQKLVWQPVIQLLGNCIIREYPNLKEAVKETGFYASGIRNCAKGKTPEFKGFQWKYLNEKAA